MYAFYTVSGNSLKRPYSWYTTDQPLIGNRNLATLYANYCVTGSSIRIKAWNNSANLDVMLVVIPRDDSTTFPGLTGNSEEIIFDQPYAKKVILLRQSQQNGAVKTIRHSATTKKFNSNLNILNDPNFQGDLNITSSLNTAPFIQFYWQIYVVTLDGAALPTTANISMEVSMDWNTCCFARKSVIS